MLDSSSGSQLLRGWYILGPFLVKKEKIEKRLVFKWRYWPVIWKFYSVVGLCSVTNDHCTRDPASPTPSRFFLVTACSSRGNVAKYSLQREPILWGPVSAVIDSSSLLGAVVGEGESVCVCVAWSLVTLSAHAIYPVLSLWACCGWILDSILPLTLWHFESPHFVQSH